LDYFLKLFFWSSLRVYSISSIGLISVNRRKRTEGEDNKLASYWRWWIKVWGANRIRDPGSPYLH